MKVNDNFVMQGILVSNFEPSLYSTHFGDIVYSIGFNVAHTKNIGPVLDHTADSFVKNRCFYVP
jgi:hypothetical protein